MYEPSIVLFYVEIVTDITARNSERKDTYQDNTQKFKRYIVVKDEIPKNKIMCVDINNNVC